MKKRVISIVLVITTLLCSSVLAVKGFSDVSDTHWAKEYILKAQESKIINGYEDGTFKPERQVKTGEFIKMVVSCKWKPDLSKELPNDVHWATPYAKLGNGFILDEESYTYLDYEKPITREEAVELIWKMYRVLSDGVKADKTGKYVKEFSDEALLTNKYRRQYFNSCIEHGLINGFEDGTLRPQETLTRAQATKLLCIMTNNSEVGGE